MAYTEKNYKTKKQLVEDVKAGVRVKCYQPGGVFPLATGKTTLEGPHYPEPHRWYATAVLDSDGYVVSVK